MRTEIILACRGELPGNLRRTVLNIKATMGPDDRLSIVLDGVYGQIVYDLPMQCVHPFDHPRGPGQCRHWATMQSAADYMIFVDGHMTFPAGWVDTICDHLVHNPHDVTCCHMEGLGPDWKRIPTEGIYDGCHLELMLPEPARKNWWLNSVWNKTRLAGGIVGSIMGACYGITREWYIAMGEPLAILEAWGGDEEILSACSWLMGGRVYLLPITCGHIWAAPRIRPEGIIPAEWIEMWANHYAMLDALPVPEPERTAARAFLDRGNNRHERIAERLDQRREAIEHLCAVLLAGAKRDWRSLETEGIIQPTKGVDKMKKQKVKPEPAPMIETELLSAAEAMVIKPLVEAEHKKQVVAETVHRLPVCLRCGGVKFTKAIGPRGRSRCRTCGKIIE